MTDTHIIRERAAWLCCRIAANQRVLDMANEVMLRSIQPVSATRKAAARLRSAIAEYEAELMELEELLHRGYLPGDRDEVPGSACSSSCHCGRCT